MLASTSAWASDSWYNPGGFSHVVRSRAHPGLYRVMRQDVRVGTSQEQSWCRGGRTQPTRPDGPDRFSWRSAGQSASEHDYVPGVGNGVQKLQKFALFGAPGFNNSLEV